MLAAWVNVDPAQLPKEKEWIYHANNTDAQAWERVGEAALKHLRETIVAEHPHVNSTSDDRTANNVMRHEYRVLSTQEKEDMQTIKDLGLDFHNAITRIGESRELSLAKTKIEEAVMWAVKHITK